MNGNRTPGFRWPAILLVGLSLSIGWGIRGNFGHEYGAMLPGALAAIAVCLLSGREDWRRRVAFFAMFGALGWGFGGSMSYMQVIAYTHSGHAPSQLYGFACLFVIGFLWAAMGGAGTAFPAVADRERLTQIFRPLCWIFALWAVLRLAEGPVIEWWAQSFDPDAHRHESPLYWFDADWLPACFALLAVLLFDLWDRRFEKSYLLVLFGGVGAIAGFALQWVLAASGLAAKVVAPFVRFEGDTEMFNADELLINWPQFFPDIAQHLGWVFGLIIGVGAYFLRFGKFRSGASLFLHMALGWLISFLILPTLLGIRMTPPRADDWAGILGVFIGTMIYLLRNGFASVAFVSIASGFIGGLAFSGAQLIKLICIAPGNPAIAGEAAQQAWAHWQHQNWHSFLEQSYGFINGIGIAVALGLLATRAAHVNEERRQRRWTEVFAVLFVLPLLTYLNLVKNVATWTSKTFPKMMKAPLIESIELSSLAWFNLIYLLMVVAMAAMLAVYLRRRLSIVPASALGKGQLLYIVLLWWMVIGNFERALFGFTEGRLLTEGVITVNAVIVTLMIVLYPRERETVPERRGASFPRLIGRLIVVGVVATVLAIVVEFGVARAVYGDKHSGHSGLQKRFGPDATWRVSPLRKGQEHI